MYIYIYIYICMLHIYIYIYIYIHTYTYTYTFKIVVFFSCFNFVTKNGKIIKNKSKVKTGMGSISIHGILKLLICFKISVREMNSSTEALKKINFKQFYSSRSTELKLAKNSTNSIKKPSNIQGKGEENLFSPAKIVVENSCSIHASNEKSIE